MRQLRFFFFVFVFFACAVQTLSAQTPSQHLRNLLDSGLYFRLRTDFVRDSAQLPPAEQHYYSSAVAYLFNQPVVSEHAFARYFALPDSLRSADSLTVDMLQWSLEKHMRCSEYAAADSVCGLVLNYPHPSLDAKELIEFKQYKQICESLHNIPKQRIRTPGAFRISWKRDHAGLITVPVRTAGEPTNFIFDSGANLSTMSYSQARKMKLRMLGTGVDVSTSTHITVSSELAVADSIKIGAATVYNVVFLVLPDNDLRFLGGLYTIDGIIGLPVIAALGEVHLMSSGEMLVPGTTTETELRNLGLHGHSPFTEMDVYGDSLTYLFDTGAATSLFDNRFLAHHAARVHHEGKKAKMHIGGAGGIQKVKGYRLKNVAYTLGGRNGTLESVSVLLTTIGGENWYYGVVGQDILKQYDRVILNFDKMFLLLR